MKNIQKDWLILTLVFMFSLSPFLVKGALAVKPNESGKSLSQAELTRENKNDTDEQVEDVEEDVEDVEQVEDVAEATGTDVESATNDEAKSKKANTNNRGQLNASEHRSAVANFVQSLLGVADREPGGIGEQVREVARAQSSSTETVVQAMEQVQARSKFKTFLFGSDYKNLGKLRSAMVQTGNRLEQLNRLMDEVVDEADKIELQNQIADLTVEQTKIDNFIIQKEQEGKISMFGWLVKLFN